MLLVSLSNFVEIAMSAYLCFISAALIIHRERFGHFGQRRSPHFGSLLRSGYFPRRERAKGLREESVHQDTQGQRGNHHVGRIDLSLQIKCRSLLLCHGRIA